MPDVLAAAAEPHRRRLLQLLASGPRTVNELAGHFPVTRSAISQHLGVLADAGLVTNTKRGRQRFYTVVPDGMAALRAEIDRFWTTELDHLVADATRMATAQTPDSPRTAQERTMSDETTASKPVEKTALLPVSPDEAFALITEPDLLRRWQTVTARVDLWAGGTYRWTVVPGFAAAGTFREVDPGRRLVFGWGWAGSPDLPPDASTVTITLEPVEGGTLVRLVHEGLDEQQAASHGEGWSHYLERLQRVAVTGDAGPDEWAATPGEMNPLTSADATLAVCQQVLRGVGEGQLGNPTPCTEFTVEQQVDHLLRSISGLGQMAGAEVALSSSGHVEARVAFAAEQALHAWHGRGLGGVVSIGPNEMPASQAAGILSIEFLVHACDFAVATGQKVHVSDELTAYVLDLAEQVISPQGRAGGAFAEALEVGPDADVLDRLLAFTGRTSSWSA